MLNSLKILDQFITYVFPVLGDYKLQRERGESGSGAARPDLAFFGNHVSTSVRICGFEARNVEDLRPDFGTFMDNKYRELPGSFYTAFLVTVGGRRPGRPSPGMLM